MKYKHVFYMNMNYSACVPYKRVFRDNLCKSIYRVFKQQEYNIKMSNIIKCTRLKNTIVKKDAVTQTDFDIEELFVPDEIHDNMANDASIKFFR